MVLGTGYGNDVSVLTVERVAGFDPDGYFHDGPELAIEVVSPSETARDPTRKIDLLLASGTLAIWVIFPDQQEVRVFLPGGDSFVRDIRCTLTLPNPSVLSKSRYPGYSKTSDIPTPNSTAISANAASADHSFTRPARAEANR